jgi:hypothetical protein
VTQLCGRFEKGEHCGRPAALEVVALTREVKDGTTYSQIEVGHRVCEPCSVGLIRRRGAEVVPLATAGTRSP